MQGDHYFRAEPAGPDQRRTISVDLSGHRVSVVTAGGVFSPEHLDTGTAVLLGEAPPPPQGGALLDLGCGWGPIALTLALFSPGASVYAVDVNERALDLTRRNASALGASRVTACRPEDVPADVRFEAIWSNPPIRVGKVVLHDMLATWLPRLEQGGEAYLVVQRNLGSDSLQRWIAASLPGMLCQRYAVARGFRVLAVRWA